MDQAPALQWLLGLLLWEPAHLLALVPLLVVAWLLGS
jgi:hypothetical protein